MHHWWRCPKTTSLGNTRHAGHGGDKKKAGLPQEVVSSGEDSPLRVKSPPPRGIKGHYYIRSSFSTWLLCTIGQGRGEWAQVWQAHGVGRQQTSGFQPWNKATKALLHPPGLQAFWKSGAYLGHMVWPAGYSQGPLHREVRGECLGNLWQCCRTPQGTCKGDVPTSQAQRVSRRIAFGGWVVNEPSAATVQASGEGPGVWS